MEKRYLLLLVNIETNQVLLRGPEYQSLDMAKKHVIRKADGIMYRTNPLARWALYDRISKNLEPYPYGQPELETMLKKATN